ncbi:MAG: hypothetical protein ACOZE5_03795 [Verrucomicrobiota bacterium]
MKWTFAVVIAGLLAAAPFLTNGPVGTNEAYNYSLGLADAVTQMRAGEVPVLAGQTEFAFNGRIHPLRTAPYLYHVAGLLDLLTCRQLGWWSLQNLVLSLSLIGGALSCYWGLRRTTPATPATAAALTALFVLSPPVLAAAYGMDLYMTVTALPFLPVVCAMGLAGLTERRSGDLLKLVAALAACWLAHPPVALWVSVVAALLLFAGFLRHPPAWREWPVLFSLALLFVVLAGFSFASALTIAPYRDVTKTHDLSLLFSEVARTFPSTLRPVSPAANQLGDFQLGYGLGGLAVVAAGLALVRRNGSALLLLGLAALLFVMTAPVPGLHRWLWTQAPAVFFNLTNQWPMQRLYLLIALLVMLAFALVWRTPEVRHPLLRDALRLALLAVVVWSGWQGLRFLGRGFATRSSEEAIKRGHVSGNINLTPISYALLGSPGSFVNGVMDPAFEFRLLAPFDAHETASNWTARLPATPEHKQGVFIAREGERPDILDLSPRLTLRPGAHYRLDFKFLVPAATATLQLRGPTMFRQYPLPAAGGPRGFGMRPGNNQALTLWTGQAEPEEIALRVVAPGIAGGPWAGSRFAEFTFDRIEPSALPVRLESLHPLRAQVVTPDAGYLETPRMFIPGYEATVNGQSVRVQPSPERLLMLPVPAGESRVEVRYAGTWITRLAFWTGIAGWLGLAGFSLVFSRRPAWRTLALARMKTSRRTGLIAGVGAMLLVSGAWGWHKWMHHRAAVGPVRLRFVLPRGETNRQQPLLVTGRPQAGMFVYVVYHDDEHVRIGVDSWGRFGFQSDPIRTDYFAEHEIVVEAGALYPPDHPRLAALPAETAARLRQRLRLEFDGRTLLAQEVDTHTSRPGEVTFGRNLIGGSSCEPRFAGEILSVERLPVPIR